MFLKSSVSLKQEIKCDKIIDFIRILYTVFIETEKYMSLPLEEQRDQVLQYHAMVIYRMALANRLKRQGVDTSADTI